MNTPESPTRPQPTCYLGRIVGGGHTHSYGFVTDWAGLDPGEQIQVFRDAEMLTAGIVDATMPDGTGVWVIQHKGLGRRLYLQCDDLRIAKPHPVSA